jgi:hypothetical protein
MFVLPLLAALVAGAFTFATWRAGRGRGALAVWAFALAQFALASFALFLGVAFGWTVWLYLIFYLFGAVVNVGWLALGTIRLFAGRYWSEVATGVLIVASLLAVYAITTTPLVPGAVHALRTSTIPEPKTIVRPGVRIFAIVFSIGGSVVVLGGLLWSLIARRRHAQGMALLAAGVVVVGVAGELAHVGLVAAFSALLAAGIAIMYAGFLRTRT